jgi:hypothetical protein
VLDEPILNFRKAIRVGSNAEPGVFGVDDALDELPAHLGVPLKHVSGEIAGYKTRHGSAGNNDCDEA